MHFNSFVHEVQPLSGFVKHHVSTVVLSDCACDTLLDHSFGAVDVIHDCAYAVSPLSAFLQMTGLAGQDLLLHPSLTDLCACPDPFAAHKTATTSACVASPEPAGIWRECLRAAQLIKDYASSDA